MAADPVCRRCLRPVRQKFPTGRSFMSSTASPSARPSKSFGTSRRSASSAISPSSSIPKIDPGADRAAWRLAQLDTLKLNPVQLRQLYGPLRSLRGFKPNPELERAQRERVRVVLHDASDARMLRAVLSRRQLRRSWSISGSTISTCSPARASDDVWIGNYEEQAIRPFALGRFRDLLFAATKASGDAGLSRQHAEHRTGQPRRARQAEAGLNENFAREVMELHTLGADGGYTQDDVVTLARILTGWGINPPNARVYPEYAAVFEGCASRLRPQSISRPPDAIARQGGRRGGARHAGAQPGDRPSHRLRARAIFCRRRRRLARWSTGWPRGSSRPTAIFERC